MCRASPVWVIGSASTTAAYLSYRRPRFRLVQGSALTLSILNFKANWASFGLRLTQPHQPWVGFMANLSRQCMRGVNWFSTSVLMLILSCMSLARGPARLACAPSECGWCPSSPLVACVAPIQRSCDLCRLRRCGGPARLACAPSECGWCPSSPLVACVAPIQRSCDLCWLCRCGGPARLACAPSECGWCPSSPLVACVAPIQRSWDLCRLRRCGVPAWLVCPPSCSYSVVQWTCSPGLPLVCLTRLSHSRVTHLMSPVAGGASVWPTWTPPGCDWCLWHLLLSYGVPVQLSSVPSRCCGCWLCLGGSVVSAGPLPSDPVVYLMSPVAGGA